MTETTSTTDQEQPKAKKKKSSFWPKLLLWSLVLLFGFLYLGSLERSLLDVDTSNLQQTARELLHSGAEGVSRLSQQILHPEKHEAGTEPAADQTPPAAPTTASQQRPASAPQMPERIEQPMVTQPTIVQPSAPAQPMMAPPRQEPAAAPQPPARQESPQVAQQQQSRPAPRPDYQAMQREAMEAARQQWEANFRQMPQPYSQQQPQYPGAYSYPPQSYYPPQYPSPYPPAYR